MSANIINADDATFDEEVLGADQPVVVDFWAPWCGPCKMVGPELEALASDRPDVKVVKVNVDDSPGVASRFGIASIPTITLFKDGNAVATSIGAKPRSAIEAELGIVPA